MTFWINELEAKMGVFLKLLQGIFGLREKKNVDMERQT